MEKRTDMVNFHIFYLIGFVSVIKQQKSAATPNQAVILRNCFLDIQWTNNPKNTTLLGKVKGRNNCH